MIVSEKNLFWLDGPTLAVHLSGSSSYSDDDDDHFNDVKNTLYIGVNIENENRLNDYLLDLGYVKSSNGVYIQVIHTSPSPTSTSGSLENVKIHVKVCHKSADYIWYNVNGKRYSYNKLELVKMNAHTVLNKGDIFNSLRDVRI